MLSTITKKQSLALVHTPEDDLFYNAALLRAKNFGTSIELCAIINARSGHCSMNCAFCSQSIHHNTSAPIFELLNEQEINTRLKELAKYPLRHVGLVTSGGALQDEQVTIIANTIQNLPKHWQGRICASLGKLSAENLALLKASGLSRFHHNLETSADFYSQICTTQTFQDRLNTVKRVQANSMEICAGGLFGLGETWEDRINFAFHLRENNITHVPINFLHPHVGTPLAKQKPLDAAEALRIIAILRHILPKATLRICGGRPLVLGARQSDIFAAGANALMTGNYLTTSGNGIKDDLQMIKNQGLEVIC